MVAKWGRKVKNAAQGAAQADTGKPERISNKLDHVLVAESKQRPKRKAKIIVIVVLVLGASVVSGLLLFKKEEPVVVKPASNEDDPFYGQEPNWEPIFEYKTKDQR